MSREEFRDAGMTLFGSWGWQTRMAENLHVHVSTVQRWVTGEVPVPGPVDAAVSCWLDAFHRGYWSSSGQ